MRGRGVDRNLECNYQQRVDCEEQSVERGRKSEILNQVKRERGLVLKEHDTHDKNSRQKDQKESVVKDCRGPDPLPLTNGRLGVHAAQRAPRGECQHRTSEQGGHSVDGKHGAERNRCEEPAESGTDAHAEIDGEAIECKCLAALLRRSDVRDGSEARRSKHLSGSGPQHCHDRNGSEALCEREQQQHRAGRNECYAHHAECSDAIAQATTDRTEHDC